jgi:hypothetical protein
MSEVENEVETNPIEDLVQAAFEKNYTAATEIFNDAIGQKMQAALDQEKIALADQIFNGVDPVDPEIEDYDTDEDVDDIADLSDEEIDEIDYDEDDEVED